MYKAIHAKRQLTNHLRYIVSNKNIYAGYVAHFREDLGCFLLLYRNRHTIPPSYKKEEKQRFQEDIVGARHQENSMPELYLNFMRENEWM